jgi:COP9 signalosome complex subunit 7
LFAYDNYGKYKTNPGGFIELSAAQLKKLKMITIVEAAQREKVLRYHDIAAQLDIPQGNVRELEDLFIDCIYNELVQGKLDQLNQQFHVVSVCGRDLRPTDIESALAKLEAWDKQLQHTQTIFENNITRQCDKAVTDNFSR